MPEKYIIKLNIIENNNAGRLLAVLFQKQYTVVKHNNDMLTKRAVYP